jgi:hypothetical protein
MSTAMQPNTVGAFFKSTQCPKRQSHPQPKHQSAVRPLNQMLRPEIGPQVHNLPRTQRHQYAHGPNRKPLDALIGTLIRITQLHLTTPEIVHLGHDLADDLLDASQLAFDRFELLVGLDGGPVLCVGANVDVELYVAREGGAVVCWETVSWA